MVKSAQLAQESAEKKKKTFISIKADESNFDVWFEQDLGHFLKNKKDISHKEFDSLLKKSE